MKLRPPTPPVLALAVGAPRPGDHRLRSGRARGDPLAQHRDHRRRPGLPGEYPFRSPSSSATWPTGGGAVLRRLADLAPRTVLTAGALRRRYPTLAANRSTCWPAPTTSGRAAASGSTPPRLIVHPATTPTPRPTTSPCGLQSVARTSDPDHPAGAPGDLDGGRSLATTVGWGDRDIQQRQQQSTTPARPSRSRCRWCGHRAVAPPTRTSRTSRPDGVRRRPGRRRRGLLPRRQRRPAHRALRGPSGDRSASSASAPAAGCVGTRASTRECRATGTSSTTT